MIKIKKEVHSNNNNLDNDTSMTGNANIIMIISSNKQQASIVNEIMWKDSQYFESTTMQSSTRRVRCRVSV